MSFESKQDIIVHILELSKNGSTKSMMRTDLSISPAQLRKTLAELVDKGFLQLIESQQLYITTHKGLKFLNKWHQQ
jgi:predicted transcriptional regulator